MAESSNIEKLLLKNRFYHVDGFWYDDGSALTIKVNSYDPEFNDIVIIPIKPNVNASLRYEIYVRKKD